MSFFRFFVRHNVLFYLLYCGSLCIVLFPVTFFLRDLYPWIASTVGILWITFFIAVIPAYAIRRSRAIANACTPEEGIRFADTVLQGADLPALFNKKYGGTMARALWIDRGTYLFFLGRFDEAIADYAYLEPYQNKIKPIYMLFMYDGLLQIAAMRGNIPLAQCYSEQQAALLQNKSVARYLKLFKLSPQQILCTNEMTLALYSGDYLRAETLFRQSPTFTPPNIVNTTLLQVSNAYMTGLLYYRLGNFTQALPQLQFAAQNGGTTFYRAEAERLLSEMQMEQ